MDTQRIHELLDLMEANGLAELEVEEKGVRVRLVKTPPAPPQVTITPAVAAPAANGSTAPGAEDAAEPAPAEEGSVLKSPIVGTFYRSPSPEADVFVEVGDEVGPETVVCIIEAMKVMNEIKAEVEGEILEILVNDAEAVEFGQPLFLLRPTGAGT